MMLSVNSIYWVNPAWNSWRVFGKLRDLLKKAVSALRSGLVAGTRDILILHDGIIKSSGCVVEQTANATIASGTLSLAFNITNAVPNGYLLVVVNAAHSSTGITFPSTIAWNGKTLTMIAGVTTGINYSNSAIYAVVNPGTGNGTITGTVTNVTTLYVEAILLSGVHQTTTVLATSDQMGYGYPASPTDKTHTLTSAAGGICIDSMGGGLATCVPGGGQTPLYDSSHPFASTIAATSASTTMTRTVPTGGADGGKLLAVSINPA